VGGVRVRGGGERRSDGDDPAATLAGVLAVEVRYLDAEDCPPLGFRRSPD